MQTLLSFIIVFGIIVLVHEYGHFYFAKKSGVLVREFAIGMGPKLFQFHKNETTYTLRALPLGGYVMMAGYEEEEDIRLGKTALITLDEDNSVSKIDLSHIELNARNNESLIDIIDYDFEHDLFIKGVLSGTEEEIEYSVNKKTIIVKDDGKKIQIAPADRQFQNASLKNRILTNIGGPLSNFILAIISFILFAFISGGVPSEEPIVGNAEINSPAAHAQLENGDKILTINDNKISTWVEMVSIVQENPNKKLKFEIQKNNGEQDIQYIIPNSVEVEDDKEIGQIGISNYLKNSIVDKIKYGFTETWLVIKTLFSSLGLLFTGKVSMDELGGPVAIYSITNEITRTAGVLGLINFIGFLSINLGIMNLLPIPGLDGGKLVLNLLEAVRGKPLEENSEAVISIIGVIILLLLMLFITWNDIQRYFLN